MTHSGDNSFTSASAGHENYVPNVAYTLGDTQPVRSTYIAHDPYFFMDVDDVTLEEELLAEFDREFSAYDAPRDEDDDMRMLNILNNFDENTSFLRSAVISFDNADRVVRILSKSRYGAALIEFAQSNNIDIKPSKVIKHTEYNRIENVILFQPALSEIELLKGLCSALRCAWQNYQGALLQPIALYPDHAVFINRAQKADLAINLVRIGWELELAGHTALWDELMHGPNRDLAHSYGREATMDFRSLNNGRAALVAFESWFLSDRSRACDAALIQKMLSDYSGHQFEDEDMSQLVMVDLIKALGQQPYGKNYLAGYIANLVTDPIFTEVRERSAANFLWFIKFEKTFSEVERGLQNELSHTASATFPSRSKGASADGLDHAETQTGILLSFPKVSEPSKSTSGKRHASGGSAEIIPFDITVRPFNNNFWQ